MILLTHERQADNFWRLESAALTLNVKRITVVRLLEFAAE